MHIPLVWLNQSPFNDYLIPGLILLVILGVFPTIVFVGLLRLKSWAWWASLLVAMALIIWIVVEIMIIGYHSQPPLQLVYGLVGIVMLVSVLSPSVKMKYQSIG
ncbi:MAG: hypothetical protein GF313_17605 [Caldithrix sp.]|nr:hypothetical protein [Caldithrix sp.]